MTCRLHTQSVESLRRVVLISNGARRIIGNPSTHRSQYLCYLNSSFAHSIYTHTTLSISSFAAHLLLPAVLSQPTVHSIEERYRFSYGYFFFSSASPCVKNNGGAVLHAAGYVWTYFIPLCNKNDSNNEKYRVTSTAVCDIIRITSLTTLDSDY